MVPYGAAGVGDCIAAVKDADGEPVGAQIVPDVLDRVQFRTVGGQGQQGEVVGDNKGDRSVPACAVGDEDGMG